MNFTPAVNQALDVIQRWDWSSVMALKVAFEHINQSKSSIYSHYVDELMRDLTRKTEAQVMLPVYPRRIIAVDHDGYALTGTIEDLRVERLPYDPANLR